MTIKSFIKRQAVVFGLVLTILMAVFFTLPTAAKIVNAIGGTFTETVWAPGGPPQAPPSQGNVKLGCPGLGENPCVLQPVGKGPADSGGSNGNALVIVQSGVVSNPMTLLEAREGNNGNIHFRLYDRDGDETVRLSAGEGTADTGGFIDLIAGTESSSLGCYPGRVRYDGADFLGCVGGSWLSLTSGSGSTSQWVRETGDNSVKPSPASDVRVRSDMKLRFGETNSTTNNGGGGEWIQQVNTSGTDTNNTNPWGIGFYTNGSKSAEIRPGGEIRAEKFCDLSGNNCFTPAQISTLLTASGSSSSSSSNGDNTP